MQTMARLLALKSTPISSISPRATVLEGLQRMAERDIGALVVLDRGRPVGLLSERDYTRKVVLQGRTSSETSVDAIMTPFELVSPDMSVEACMDLMTTERLRYVLVMEDGRLHGIVSMGDLVKATIDEQQFTITQLAHYITS